MGTKRNPDLENRLVAKRKDYIRMSLKHFQYEMRGKCPYCGNVLQYSVDASCQLDELVLRCAGPEHHDFRRKVDYAHFYTVIDGGKAA